MNYLQKICSIYKTVFSDKKEDSFTKKGKQHRFLFGQFGFMVLLLPLLFVQPYLLLCILLEGVITVTHICFPRAISFFQKTKSLLLLSVLLGYVLSILEPILIPFVNSIFVCTITLEGICVTQDIVNCIEFKSSIQTPPTSISTESTNSPIEAYCDSKEAIPSMSIQDEKKLILKKKRH